VTISLIGFAIVLLIAYWWLGAGALGGFLHFACVVIAGAIAFAAWEPVAYLLIAGPMGGYAKGVSLLGIFIVSLLVLRMTADRLVPQDLQLPKGANMALGGLFGAASGVLSVGMLAIGCGYLQSTVSIGDFTGWSRRSDVPGAPTIGSDDAPILHVVDATAGFYSFLSGGAFSPWFGGGTIGTHAPQLGRSSASLYRDSYADGMARVGIQPEAVTELKLLDIAGAMLSGAVNAAPAPAWGVEFGVTQDGFDGNGVQFVISASQIRLVGDGKSGTAAVAHPVSWVQPDKEANLRQYYFNSATSYACSVESQGDGKFLALFPKDALRGQQPRFIELKGVRFRVPAAVASAAPVDDGSSRKAALIEDADATDISGDVDFPSPKYSIKGTVINLNAKGGLVVDGNNFIVGGEQKFPKSTTSSVSSDLQVKGFKIGEEECVLRLDATARRGSARIFPDLNPWISEAAAVGQAARVAVVDANGAKYYAVGYIYDDGEFVQVKSFGGSPIALRNIPVQSVGGNTKLTLYFRVPAETRIVGLVLSTPKEDRLVNTMSVSSPKKE
jgi:hypothetical protein